MTEDPFRRGFSWEGPSEDPEDEQFGDIVATVPAAEAAEHPAVLVGEPYDGGVIGRRGAREGPEALRTALAATKTHHFDAGPAPSPGDLGDVRALVGRSDDRDLDDRTTSTAAVQRRVTAAAGTAYDTGSLPVFLGGDNSLTVGNVRPLLDRADSVGVISFDAHLDCRSVRDDPTSGTPYRQLLGEGLDALAVVGARHFETSTAYAEYLRDRGGTVLTAEEIGDDPIAAADRALETAAGVDALFVSVDLDVLDAPAAPGVSAPTPGGISTRELYRTLRLVAADARLAGLEVVECAPRLEDGDRTARAGSRAIAHALAATGASGDARPTWRVDGGTSAGEEP